MSIRTPRVLSIQSCTTYGVVGNKVATLALQLLGMEVITYALLL